MPTALDTSYLGNRLSDNIDETPEGYLICRNAVIGRTGFQTYLAGELDDPDGLLGEVADDQEIPVWRDEREVFSPATLASFEGKTFTLTHPDRLLDSTSDREHHVGHVQNVRKGKEPLEGGTWPLLADVIVKDADTIRAIKNGARELSCGYAYTLGKTGDRFEQRNIVGNHVALVQKGRAGSEARIQDSAPAKERLTVKNLMAKIFGIGLASYAKDAKPEEVAEVLEQLNTDAVRAQYDGPTGKAKLRLVGTDEQGHKLYRLTAMDESEEERERKAAEDRKRAKDEEERKEREAKDAKGRDAADRKRLHDALDRVLDSHEQEEHRRTEEEDADLKELGNLFNEHMREEAKEPEHRGQDEEIKPLEDESAEEKEKREREEKEARDRHGKDESEEERKRKEGEDAEVVRPEPDLPPEDRPKSQFDSAAETLRALRPIIARSSDKTVRKAFDQIARSLNAARRAEKDGSTPGYGPFASAARKHAADAVPEGAPKRREGESGKQYAARVFDDMYKQERSKRTASGREAAKK